MKGEYGGYRYAAVQRCLSREVERYFLHRRTPRWLANVADLDEDGALAERYAAHGPATRVTVSTMMVESPDRAPWRSNVGYTFAVDWGGRGHHARSGGMRYPYQLPARVVAAILVRTALRTAIYSKGSVDVLVLIGLAALAAVMCVYQLATAIA
ncbi:MAG TPA: hypothetical protein VF534_00945 [Paraburkholderia sp.]